MNPPSAIHGAMGRERKPFTYTPGGLDLSEIKSERMAKRLMRNAMNQGVPELPAQSIQSPPTPSTPIAVPNFNCLPVQVFPTFALPANPKSLLRTRSTPDQQREPQPLRVPPPSTPQNSFKPSGIEQLRETMNNNNHSYSPVNSNGYNNSRPVSLYDNNTASTISNSSVRNSYGSDAFTAPVLPEISYEVEYFQAAPRNGNKTESAALTASVTSENDRISPIKEILDTIDSDFTIKPISEANSVFETVIKPVEDNAGTDDDEQREVKVVKKQVKKEQKVESQNGDQNGEATAEAEMTVKLPTKKSAAKTETKVEVVKKVLPDGSVEEIKTTTTRTTIDGKTEIRTKTETTIIPKEEEVEVEEEEEDNGEVVVQEVEENGQEEVVEEPTTVVIKKAVQEAPKEEKIVKKEERSEITTTKKVVVVQKEEQEAEEEEEEEEVEEAEPVVVKKPVEKPAEKPPSPKKVEVEEEEEEEEEEVVEKHEEEEQKVEKVEVKQPVAEEEEEEEEEDIEVEVEKKEVKLEPKKEEPKEEEEEAEEEEDFEEAVEPQEKSEPKIEKPAEPVKESKEQKEDEESEYTEEEVESEKEEPSKQVPAEEPKAETKEPVKEELAKEQKQEEPAPQPEQKVPLREPSIPLEKVEDVEIKPIGLGQETVSKSHTERTEIITSANDKPAGVQSTQTEYNRIENIVTVNRTTKTLDHSYEQLTQQGIPTVKTYFAPDRERVSTSPQPSRPYQPVYPPPQQQPERRHSLLLERLSTERQMPSDIYQNTYQNNQSYEQQRQWSQEPQSEVINVSNVKPSTITNQQWYQQQQSRKDNVLYNNVLPTTPIAPNQQWSQPQPQLQPQTQYQTSYSENTSQDTSRITSNTYQQNSYPTYTPKPTNWATNNLGSAIPTINTQPNQYSFLNKDSSESYNNSQYSSTYVPPPWEQDPNYVAPELPKQTNYYQPAPSTNTFSASSKPGWKISPPPGKFSKPAPTSYVPPAPNQSFVKHANSIVEPPKLPGRKTYYSEYERRYISVPESTYIPGETKYQPQHQPQPDPSPQYFYDNSEPTEAVEHQWRKELREFTEKTSQTLQTEQTSVKPPWEEEAKYAKVPTVTYTPTPSWSQTLRPQTWRERSFESEYVGSKEWAKTNTLGRGRPLSSYGNTIAESPIPERARGVSVDRYNPNNYQPPITSEHAPVQTHTHNPTPSQGYHNPNVPAYHARASAEPREPTAPIPHPRQWGDTSRATPIQSRSFKYLQWITGTED